MHIDLSISLTILGIILTIVFGFLSIDLFKRKKNPGKLTLIKQSTLGLFNNIAKNFDEILILYKAEPIKENVIYLKASFLNDGDIDIDGKTVEKALNLELKNNLKWIKAKVTKTSPELICNSEILSIKQNLRFNFGLMKKREFFQFEALVESNDSKIEADDIYENIVISHRIANTQKVNTTSLLSEEQIVRKKKRIKSFGFIAGVELIIVVVFFLIQFLYLKDAPIYYKDSVGQSYTVKAKSNDKIQLTNTESKEETIILIKDFQIPNKYIPFIPKQTFWDKFERFTYVIPLAILAFLYLIGNEYWDLRKSKEIYSIFEDS